MKPPDNRSRPTGQQGDSPNPNEAKGTTRPPDPFHDWLVAQQHRDDWVGHLAMDVAQDRTWPGPVSLVSLRGYFEHLGADNDVLRALNAAYGEWEESRSRRLATLTDDFWLAREELGHIRQAAHARGRSADLVLGATLARLSAMVDPGLRLDTGLAEASLNLYVAAIGRSGIGKTAGARAAKELVETPDHLVGYAFQDGIPVGSGEGLVEAYFGWEMVETGETTRDGKPKLTKVKTQVRRHVFAFVDEGQALTATMDRSGTTIGPILRSMWTGELAGQANAREETTRVLEAGSYALGVVIGFQRATAGPLLDDAGAGTPQRFVWLSATDPSLPDDQPEHPGQLKVPGLTDGMVALPHKGLIPFAPEYSVIGSNFSSRSCVSRILPLPLRAGGCPRPWSTPLGSEGAAIRRVKVVPGSGGGLRWSWSIFIPWSWSRR
jgi:hypothetical protein